jgi:dephospho-CoA kinase
LLVNFDSILIPNHLNLNMPLKVGLTGGIGSGKTTVARIFEILDIPVYYADEAAKRIMNSDTALIGAIKKNFGEKSYDGAELNREFLASVVFNDPYQLELLNSLVHPATINDAGQWMQKQQAPYVIKEAALLFESSAASGLDLIIGVSAPAALRLKRTMERDGSTREEILKRMNRQIEESIKMKLCDFVLYNDEQQLLIPQVLELHEKLLLLARTNR